MQEKWQFFVHKTCLVSGVTFPSHHPIVKELVQRSLFLIELTIVEVIDSWEDTMEETSSLVLVNCLLQSELFFFRGLTNKPLSTARFAWITSKRGTTC